MDKFLHNFRRSLFICIVSVKLSACLSPEAAASPPQCNLGLHNVLSDTAFRKPQEEANCQNIDAIVALVDNYLDNNSFDNFKNGDMAIYKEVDGWIVVLRERDGFKLAPVLKVNSDISEISVWGMLQ